jgi:hypothetical protein
MRATVPAATVRTLVGAIADDHVRDLLIELLLNGLTPAQPTHPRGRHPRGRPRKTTPSTCHCRGRRRPQTQKSPPLRAP